MEDASQEIRGRVLITGPSGSGKSTLSRYFKERGIHAVDADDVRGLCKWVDASGKPRRLTKGEWRRYENVQFFWDEGRLRRFLSRNPDVILFGASDNMFDLAHLFDRRIFLHANWTLIRARLNHPKRDNDWGQEPAQRDWIKKTVGEWPKKARAAGFEFIDAALPPADAFQHVCVPHDNPSQCCTS
jgi:adenylate kinase family enzyme